MTNQGQNLITFDSLRGCQQPIDTDDDGNDIYPELSVEYNHFTRQKRGHLYVGKMTKSFAFNPSTMKSLYTGEGDLTPFGPNTQRLPKVQKPKAKAQPLDLPPVVYEARPLKKARRHVSEDSDEGFEMSDEESENAMAKAIAEQDRHRTEHWLQRVGDMVFTS